MLKTMTLQQAVDLSQGVTVSGSLPLPFFAELQAGDLLLDYKPSEKWFVGAIDRAKKRDGWTQVTFRTEHGRHPSEYVKIAGNLVGAPPR
jgi:hypothetical protein